MCIIVFLLRFDNILELGKNDMNDYVVRVQSDFTGISIKDNKVHLQRMNDIYRNTIHFSINGAVGSHEMGNWDNCGIVIMTKVRDVDAPVSGLRIEDTWFHASKDGLNLGEDAFLMVPKGVDIPENLKHKVISYDFPSGSENAVNMRNQAVHEELKKRGVSNLYDIGRNGAAGVNLVQFNKITDDLKSKFKDATHVKHDIHMNSQDRTLETMVSKIENMLERIKKNGDIEFDEQTSQDFSLIKYCKDFIQKSLLTLKECEGSSGVHAKHYFDRIKQGIEEKSKQLSEIDKKIKEENQAPFNLKLNDDFIKTNLSYEDIKLYIKENVSNAKNNDLFSNIQVVDIRKYRGEDNRVLGSMSEVFTSEIRSEKNAQINLNTATVFNNIQSIRNNALDDNLNNNKKLSI